MSPYKVAAEQIAVRLISNIGEHFASAYQAIRRKNGGISPTLEADLREAASAFPSEDELPTGSSFKYK